MKKLLFTCLIAFGTPVLAEVCVFEDNKTEINDVCEKQKLRLTDEEICCSAIKKCLKKEQKILYASVDTVFAGCNSDMATNADSRKKIKYIK